MSHNYEDNQQTDCSIESAYFPAMLGRQLFEDAKTAAVSTHFKKGVIVDSPSGQENKSPSSALENTDKEIINFRICCLSREIQELHELLYETPQPKRA
jgi:hypothetical protein